MIIAEIGLAHMGRMDYAKRLIDEARGADIVKFQVYKVNDLIDKNRDPVRYKRFKERQLSYEQFVKLKEYAEVKGLQFLGTPHTVDAFEFLKGLGCDFKIGSGDREEILPLAVDSGRKVYVSTGMRTHSEVVHLMLKYWCTNTIFMHCVTMYPVIDNHADLAFIRTMQEFGRVGYSDHVPGTIGCEIATALGAEVIEKHIRLDESKGQDNLCALTGKEFRIMCKKLNRIKTLMGNGRRHYSAEEKQNESWALKKDGKRPYLF